MNRTVYIIFIIFFAFALAWAFVVSSIKVGTRDTLVTNENPNEIIWSKISLTPLPGGLYDAKSEKIEDFTTQKFSKNSPILVDFWRLSSFLYNSLPGAQSWVIEKISWTGILLGDVSGIISLYDLFMMYTIHDTKDRFRLDQITNGSFYIGKEIEDGGEEKISVYAIDGVVRLTFLNNKEDMTSLILFPGSYIRFNPARNRSLKDADLFRTILSLKENENEVFEFVNPRVNIGQEDTFFNYRLPRESMALFRILSALSRQKVDAINTRKSYNPYASNIKSESSWLINPSKKNHNMLLRLSELLTQVIGQQDSKNQIAEISKIYDQAKKLNLKDATAKWLVEQFLLDWRFAVYGGVANSKYQDSYEEIARMIGIHASSGQTRLLQSLADIYSRNLFTQKRSENSIIINTYNPTAGELSKTLDIKDLQKKDYFDIAFYAFNILRKMEKSPQVLLDTAMEDTATYSYLVTFFRASNHYIESITDVERKQQTITSFAQQFYDYLLWMIVNSLYKEFTIVEDKALYLAPDYQEWIKVTISDEIMNSIETLHGSVEFMIPSIEALWSGSWQKDDDSYNRIHDNIIRLSAFMEMIDEEGYKSYTEMPYKYDEVAGERWVILPALTEDWENVVKLDKKMVEKLRNQKIITTDPRISELKKIWPNADATNWGIEDNNIRIVDAPYRVARADGEVTEVFMTILYKDKTFTDWVIKYGKNTLRIYIPSWEFLTIPQLYAFFADLQYYLDTIDSRLSSFNGDVGEIRLFPMKQRVNIGDSLYTVEVP